MNNNKDPCNVQFIDMKGERKVECTTQKNSMLDYTQPMKIMKNNIGTKENTRMAIVGD